MVNIGVVGAGIVGLSSAVNAQKAFPNAKVTIMADKFMADTTSHGAGGLFRLVPQVDLPNYDVMRQCSSDSWQFISALARSPECKESGISTVTLTALYNTSQENDFKFMRETAHDFQTLSEEKLRKRGFDYKYGYSFTTYIVQPPYYMEWMTKRFLDNGGVIQTRKVTSLKNLYGEFDLVINCCGLGARELVGDESMGPVRGQLITLKAPWIKQAYCTEDNTYIMPQQDRLLVGVVRQKGRYDTEIDPVESQEMFDKALRLVPELKGAEMVGAWSGLRPTRESNMVRLETEYVECSSGQNLLVVHNYGHGAHGISLSWGTAVHAVSLAQRVIALDEMSYCP